MAMQAEDSDLESNWEEEIVIPKQTNGWSLDRKVALGVGIISAIVLMIAIPVAVTSHIRVRRSSFGPPDTTTNDIGMNVGVGTNGKATASPVDVVKEDPTISVVPPKDTEIASVAPPENIAPLESETFQEESETESESNIPQQQVETPIISTPSPTSVPKTLAPVSTETACSSANVTQDTTSWFEITADPIVGESANDLSGRSIAMSADGSILAIAAALNSDKGKRTGHVRVYRFASGEYTQMGTDLDGEADYDWFGTSLALDASGLRLAVGGRWNDGKKGNDTGHVRLFHFSESLGNWEQVGDDLEGLAPGDQFGCAVALSADGNRLAVGATNADKTTNITDVGHVYVYDISDESFLPMGSFQGDAKNDLSGASISLSDDGSHVAIASHLHDLPNGIPDVGQVKVYGFNSQSNVWSKIGSNIEGKVAGTQAGVAVALSVDGKRVAVTYPQFIMGIPSPGLTRIYELKDVGWTKLGSNDLIGGSSVSMSRNGRVAVGDNLGFSGGTNSGFVHVYDFNEEAGAWDLVGQAINGIRGEMSGTSVVLSADGLRVAISSPRAGDEGQVDKGAVRVYDLCEPL